MTVANISTRNDEARARHIVSSMSDVLGGVGGVVYDGRIASSVDRLASDAVFRNLGATVAKDGSVQLFYVRSTKLPHDLNGIRRAPVKSAIENMATSYGFTLDEGHLKVAPGSLPVDITVTIQRGRESHDITNDTIDVFAQFERMITEHWRTAAYEVLFRRDY